MPNQLMARIASRFADHPFGTIGRAGALPVSCDTITPAPWLRDWRRYGDAHSRLTLWPAHVAQVPRLHHRGHPHAGYGIGANTAIFSLIDGILMRGLPVQDAQHLVVLRWSA